MKTILQFWFSWRQNRIIRRRLRTYCPKIEQQNTKQIFETDPGV